MPVHIGQLISNVTITQRSSSGGGQTMGVPADTAPASEALAPLDLVLRQPASVPLAPSPADPTGDVANGPAPPLQVDSKALAERVYRLLRDEAAIARERE